MSEIDFAELDKEVTRAMENEKPKAKVARETTQQKMKIKAKPVTRGRYMDIVHPSSDMRRGLMRDDAEQTEEIAETGSAGLASRNASRELEVEMTEIAIGKQEISGGADAEFGVIEDVVRETEALQAEEDFARQPMPLTDMESELVPNANNYSLGGRSPFIVDAKIEKRPLGSFVPEGSTRGIHSTKNVYSQRAPMLDERPEQHARSVVVHAPKRHNGWIWALVTLGVLAVGGGLGVLIYMLYTSS